MTVNARSSCPAIQASAPHDLERRESAFPGLWRRAAALAVLAAPGLSGCVSDPDCGVCDPDHLILQSIAGVNYAGKLVKLLGPECVGDACPGPTREGQYFVEKMPIAASSSCSLPAAATLPRHRRPTHRKCVDN